MTFLREQGTLEGGFRHLRRAYGCVKVHDHDPYRGLLLFDSAFRRGSSFSNGAFTRACLMGGRCFSRSYFWAVDTLGTLGKGVTSLFNNLTASSHSETARLEASTETYPSHDVFSSPHIGRILWAFMYA